MKKTLLLTIGIFALPTLISGATIHSIPAEKRDVEEPAYVWASSGKE